MKKLIAILSVVCVFGLSIPHQTQAHVLKSEGTVGAVLHILPQDDPAAGEATTLVLSFKDTAEKMRLQECDCTLSLKRSGETISTVQLEDDAVARSVQRGTAVVTFPETGVYELIVEGSPTSGESFSPFLLEYSIRVARNSGAMTKVPDEASTQKRSFLADGESQRTAAQFLLSLIGVVVMVGLPFVVMNNQKINN